MNRNITQGEENEFEENILVQREFKTYYNNKTIFISLLNQKNIYLYEVLFMKSNYIQIILNLLLEIKRII